MINALRIARPKYSSLAVLAVVDNSGDLATLPQNPHAWRKINVQQLKGLLTIPQCHDMINFTSNDRLRAVHVITRRTRRGFSQQPDGETTEVNDPEGDL